MSQFEYEEFWEELTDLFFYLTYFHMIKTRTYQEFLRITAEQYDLIKFGK